MNLQDHRVTAGLSLSHLLIHDTRADCPIHANYRTPLSFGALAKPAVTVLLAIDNYKPKGLEHLLDFGAEREEDVADIKVSVAVGELKVVPTAWLYDIVDIANAVVRNVVTDEVIMPKLPARKEKEVMQKEVKKKEMKEEKEVKMKEEKKSRALFDTPFGPNIAFDLHVEHPSIFILENTSEANTSSFMISLAIAASASISATRDIDAALGITDIRGCRSSPLAKQHPPPGMMDAITPFDVNLNLHVRDDMQKVSGTLMTNHDLELRVGVMDVKLFSNAMYHLLPTDRRHLIQDVKADEKKEKKEHREKGERTEREVRKDKGLVADIDFKAIINSVSITVVNDTKDFEIPVMQVVVGDMTGDVTRRSGEMDVTMHMSLFAEYYNEQRTVWEPVLEKWEVKLTVHEDPRDRVVGVFSVGDV